MKQLKELSPLGVVKLQVLDADEEFTVGSPAYWADDCFWFG
jgi:hypothetical protein